jgi:hypothetical protein
MKTVDELIDKLGEIANENGIDSAASMVEWLPQLFKEHSEMKVAIENAKGCLVCAAISNPSEICETTYQMLNTVKTDKML